MKGLIVLCGWLLIFLGVALGISAFCGVSVAAISRKPV